MHTHSFTSLFNQTKFNYAQLKILIKLGLPMADLLNQIDLYALQSNYYR